MSASERLRELDRLIPTDKYGFRDEGFADLVDVREALPEIIAVVEAAENFDARFEQRFINGMAKPLNESLAALEAKLT